MDAVSQTLQALWIGGLAATPLVLVIGLVCRVRMLRPSTRHLLWCAALASLAAPALGWWLWRPDWFRSESVLAAADRALGRAGPSASGNVAADVGPRMAYVGPLLLPMAASPVNLHDRAAVPTLLPSTGPNAEARRLAYELPLPLPATYADAKSGAGGTPMAALGNPGADRGRAGGLLAGGVSGRIREPVMAAVGRHESPKVLAPAEPAQQGLKTESLPAKTETADAFLTVGAVGQFLRGMVGSLVGLRDWLAALPPLPAAIWLGGTLLLVGASLVRTVLAARALRDAHPAGREIKVMVVRTSRWVGLRRPPETFVVHRAISPLIWCGLKAKLVLPRELWDSLDDESRRAVLVHELAHLKRLDHVWCWIEMLIGALYWWHPLAWWARLRLRDEAEASCDAWVTSTLPNSRRAYATALVATKSFVSMRGWGAQPSLGIMSGSATKMARRITMVMTQKPAPKMSFAGACMAASVVVLGAFVMPGVACPPEEASANKAAKAEMVKAKAAKNRSTPEAEFLGEAPALEAMKRNGVVVVPATPSAAGVPAAPVAPVAPVAPRVRVNISGDGQCDASRAHVLSAEDAKAGKVARVYRLPKGKLDAFWGLMSRSDVPVFVERRSGDLIVIYAREQDHPSIGAFITIINPGGSGGQTPVAVQGRAAARGGSVTPSLNAYRNSLRALEAEQAALERNAERMRTSAETLQSHHEQLEEATQRLKEQAAELKEQQAKRLVEGAAAQMKARSDEARVRGRGAENQIRQIERQIEQIERRADELREKISQAEDSDDSEGALAMLEEQGEAVEIDADGPAQVILEMEPEEVIGAPEGDEEFVGAPDTGDDAMAEPDEVGEEMGATDEDLESPMMKGQSAGEPNDDDADDEEEEAAAPGTPVPAVPPAPASTAPAPAPVATPTPASPAAAPSPAPAAAPAASPTPAAAPAPAPAPTPTPATSVAHVSRTA